MIDREKVIKGLEICSEHGSWHGLDCELNEAYKDCPYRGCETGCIATIAKDAIELLEEQDKTIESLTEEKERLLLERIAELQHSMAALHAAMQDTILVNNAIEQRQALKREYMRGYDKVWDEIGGR